MKKPRLTLCGTPKEHCSGTNIKTDQMLRTKAHNSPGEAYDCYARYLVRVLGYTRGRNREFAPPDGGHTRVLTKKSRFGAQLRPGKEGRMMPRLGGAGTIVSK